MTTGTRFAVTLLLFVLLASAPAAADWPDDPAENLVICDRSGEQAVTKIVATSDGGCYVSWYDHSSGNYDVYLQRLDGEGVPQWADGGIVVSDHPQETWVTDYDLACDHTDHAIVLINDIRAGADRDIYAYRISPAGDFVWGADGLTVSANEGFEPDQQIVVTSNNNVVFAWQEDTVVHLRKVSPAGADLWDPATIDLTSTYGYSIPRLAEADADGFILQALYLTGSGFYDPKHIMVFKFDADGNHLWSTTGETVSDAGGIALWMEPDLIADGSGGAYSYWYDTRNMIHHAYVQHVDGLGAVQWTDDGVNCSTSANRLQMDPAITRLPGSNDVIVFFRFTDPNQNQSGVGAQRLNENGERQWTDDGAVLVPLASNARWSCRASAQDGGAIVTYLDDLTVVNAKVMAIRVDGDGNHVWPTSPVELTTNESSKAMTEACLNPLGQVICAWADDRNDSSGDIYLQNVNPDGSLGDVSDVPGTPRLVAGPGPGYDNPPQVRVFPCEQSAPHLYEFDAYGPERYGVRVSTGDVDGDLLSEILTGAGPGAIYGPHVRGFDVDGTPIAGLSFLAYGTNKWGVNVTAGDFDGDGFDEIATGAGPGAVFGPHVRGWDFDGSGAVSPMAGVSYFAYGTPKYGVNVTAGDIDGDGYDEIISGAGPGAVYGPHVRGWNVDGGTAAAIPGVSFLAYGTNKWGVNVGCGDVDGDGIDEILTAPGPSALFGPHVRGWDVDGGSATAMPSLNFMVWDPAFGGNGARISSGTDLDNDGRDDFVVAAGPDPHFDTQVSAYQYHGAGILLLFRLTPFDDEMTHGADPVTGRF